ncbi:PEPxxWA-CTERM sorting domain-containing protein [Phenylobacterium sp.]|uniref:PEPxxWA-CTERM sorting domain-containing protein n=1 Tax=Phenylobacterium sp. TaxID=1871053 RepID=UPI0025DD92C7|nr:PEPxxWA-CTERM sorting domain-containing protein [Phenylobacterium sp.]
MSNPPHRRRWAARASVASLVAVLGATPAMARELDCFTWVRQAAAHIAPRHSRPHAAHAVPHRVRHIVRAARPHPIATRYVRMPIACPTREAMASPVPGAVPPQTAQALLDDLASRPAAAEAVGVPAAATTPRELDSAPFSPPGGLADGLPLSGVPGGVVLGGGPGSPPDTIPIVVGAPGGPGAVPEPSAWLLMLVGFGAAGGALRRRRIAAP